MDALICFLARNLIQFRACGKMNLFLKMSQDQAVLNHSAPVEMPTEMPDSRMAGWPVLLLRPLNDAIAKGEFSERFCIRRKMRINVCLYCH